MDCLVGHVEKAQPLVSWVTHEDESGFLWQITQTIVPDLFRVWQTNEKWKMVLEDEAILYYLFPFLFIHYAE